MENMPKFANITGKSQGYMTEKLDETDLKILRTLQKNAKLTTKELADAVHLTPTPVFERQKRLERQGYIKKYVAILDPDKLNQSLQVFCKVKLKQINHEIADAFTRRIMRIPEVTECYNTSGNYDYLLKVRAADMKQYQEFVLNKLGEIESLASIESTFVMSEIKKYNEWRLSLIGVLFSLLTLGTSCANEDKPIDEPVLKGIISSYNEYDGAMLDFTKADMEKAGFTLGDVVSITIDDKTFIIPYYDGYYSRGGELLLVAYPSYPSICFTASNTGLPMELKGLVGHAVTVRMKEKGGCLNVQPMLAP